MNHSFIIEHLAIWLATYIKNAGRNVFVVGFNGTRSDALLLQICSKATENYGGLSTHALAFGTKSIDITKVFNGKITHCIDKESIEYYYLGCHDIANNNGIVVGPVDKSFGKYSRNYGKRAEGSADVFPLFDMNYSDIINITDSLWPNLWPECNTASDLEFCNNAESLYGIITCEESPHKHSRWPYFIQNQKSIIAKVHQREKLTRHKDLSNKPYPKLPVLR
jgi:hypothetical protein